MQHNRFTFAPLIFMASVHPPSPHPKFPCDSKQESFANQTSACTLGFLWNYEIEDNERQIYFI